MKNKQGISDKLPIKPVPNHAVLTVTTPTIELNTSEQLKGLIQPHSSYQIIPFSPTHVYDVYEHIAEILPLTK